MSHVPLHAKNCWELPYDIQITQNHGLHILHVLPQRLMFCRQKPQGHKLALPSEVQTWFEENSIVPVSVNLEGIIVEVNYQEPMELELKGSNMVSKLHMVVRHHLCEFVFDNKDHLLLFRMAWVA